MRPIGPQRTTRGFTLIEMLIVIAILAALAGVVVPMVGGTEDQSKATVTVTSMTAVRDGFVGVAATPGMYSDLRYLTGFDARELRVGHLLIRPTISPNIPEYDAASRKGWRGPYARGGYIRTLSPTGGTTYPAPGDVRHEGDDTFAVRGFHPADAFYGRYTLPAEAAMGDAWGNPIVLQIPTLDKNGSTFATSEEAWKYARLVSAGPDGRLDTVLNGIHLSAYAGKLSNNTAPARGDDIVLFLNRTDVYEP